MSSAGDFNGKEVERPRSLEAEKTPRLLPHEFRPFLSKLLGKTSKLQIFPSKLRVFPSKLRVFPSKLRRNSKKMTTDYQEVTKVLKSSLQRFYANSETKTMGMPFRTCPSSSSESVYLFLCLLARRIRMSAFFLAEADPCAPVM